MVSISVSPVKSRIQASWEGISKQTCYNLCQTSIRYGYGVQIFFSPKPDEARRVLRLSPMTSDFLFGDLTLKGYINSAAHRVFLCALSMVYMS